MCHPYIICVNLYSTAKYMVLQIIMATQKMQHCCTATRPSLIIVHAFFVAIVSAWMVFLVLVLVKACTDSNLLVGIPFWLQFLLRLVSSIFVAVCRHRCHRRRHLPINSNKSNKLKVISIRVILFYPFTSTPRLDIVFSLKFDSIFDSICEMKPIFTIERRLKIKICIS